METDKFWCGSCENPMGECDEYTICSEACNMPLCVSCAEAETVCFNCRRAEVAKHASKVVVPQEKLNAFAQQRGSPQYQMTTRTTNTPTYEDLRVDDLRRQLQMLVPPSGISQGAVEEKKLSERFVETFGQEITIKTTFSRELPKAPTNVPDTISTDVVDTDILYAEIERVEKWFKANEFKPTKRGATMFRNARVNRDKEIEELEYKINAKKIAKQREDALRIPEMYVYLEKLFNELEMATEVLKSRKTKTQTKRRTSSMYKKKTVEDN